MKGYLLVFSLFVMVCQPLHSQENNPFSVYHNAETITAPAETEVEEVTDTKLKVDNPFTVSHIPIRKNQYKKIESLRTIPRQQKESISLSYLPLWITTFCFCLLAYLLFIKKQHVNNLVRSLLNDNYLRMMSYEENGGKSLPYMIGYLIFIINIILFVVLVTAKLEVGVDSNWLKYIVASILLFILGKHLVLSIVSWIFEFEKEADLYQFTIVSFRNVMALVFLLINVLIIFGGESWVRPLAMSGIIIFLIFLFSRYYKGLKISRTYVSNNFFHFFLYFCAFEITPWLFVYKMTESLV